VTRSQLSDRGPPRCTRSYARPHGPDRETIEANQRPAYVVLAPIVGAEAAVRAIDAEEHSIQRGG
jgi:hypothetical protein